MASLNKVICKDLLDSVLPSFGNPRVHIPIWDNSQKMFILNEYESARGLRYYMGMRYCENLVVVEKVGLFNNWTYIDSVELYAFNGNKLELIQKRDYEKVFRSEKFVRSETKNMVSEYLLGVAKTQGLTISVEDVELQSESIVERCYKSFLDKDFNIHVTKILPALLK